MAIADTMPVPPHFDPAAAGEVRAIPYLELASAAEAWAAEHGIPLAHEDETRTCLLLVDCQVTFCVPGAELFVAGRSGSAAVDDTVRTCRFIYEHLGAITEIYATMDTHTALQIFHPVFWVNDAGEHPEPHTELSLADVESGRWRVNPAMAPALRSQNADALQQHAVHYARRLTESGKYPLIVWPYHGMVGGVSHALVPALEEACFFHTIARSSQTTFHMKGDNPLTESYSVLGPEVLDRPDGTSLAQKNASLIERLLSFDRLIIAGQAKSHCVAWTVADLLDEIHRRDERLASKVYLLEDCTSAVVVPDVVDFTQQADEAFERFAAAGMRIVQSTAPMRDWPGVS